MNKKLAGKIGLFFVAIIWGTGYVASAVALDYFTPLQVLAFRFLISGILMLLVFMKQLKKISRTEIKHGIILGSCLYLAFLFQTVGLNHTTASNNAFLTSVNVVLVPILSFFLFRTPIKKNVMLGAILSLSGIGFLSLGKMNSLNIGDILTLICAIFFALQILLTSHFLKKDQAISLSIIQMVTAGVIAVFVSLVENEPITTSVSSTGYLSIVYLGAISTMLAFLLQTISQKFTTESETAVILSTESLFGMLASILLLGEEPTFRMIIGGLLIFIGVLVTEWKTKSN